MKSQNLDRRGFITTSVLGLGALSIPQNALSKNKEEEISPVEDLMREHGVLNRILLIYEENLKLIRKNKSANTVELQKSAKIIRSFLEDYHGKLEEDFVFPRFEKANKEVELVKTLRQQHKAGRVLTDIILKGSRATDLEGALQKFVSMYMPHEAREDTVLFPQFRNLVSESEYKELGEKFEDREHELFGKEGFTGIVKQVAEIEKSLGIYDLSQFTPK